MQRAVVVDRSGATLADFGNGDRPVIATANIKLLSLGGHRLGNLSLVSAAMVADDSTALTGGAGGDRCADDPVDPAFDLDGAPGDGAFTRPYRLRRKR